MYYLPEQLHNIDTIVEETQKQHDLFKEVSQEVQKMKTNLFALKLSKALKNKSDIDISHVEVIVCSSISEVEETKNEDEYTNIEKLQGCKFLTIEVFIPKFLHTVFIETKLNVCICVSYGQISVSRTLLLGESSKITETIAVDELLLNCEVNVLFFGKIGGKNITLKIPTVQVDVSYFLMPHYDMKKNIRMNRKIDKLMKLGTLYNIRHRNMLKEYYSKYRLFNSLSQQFFMETMLKNCYTFINLNSFVFNDKSSLHIKNNDLKAYITYDSDSGTLQLESTTSNLYYIKKYFIKCLDLHEDKEETRIKKLIAFNTSDYDTSIERYNAFRVI